MALAWRVDTQEATVSVTEMRFERLLGCPEDVAE